MTRITRQLAMAACGWVIGLLGTPAMAQPVTQDWTARNLASPDDDQAYDIAVDGEGCVYVTGWCYRNTSSWDEDYLTIKYDPAGVELWRQQYDSPNNGSDIANALDLDSVGNVFVTGVSDGDCVTIKYDTNGNQMWLKRTTGAAGADIEVEPMGDGNVFVTGSSGANCFTIRYLTSTGQIMWTKTDMAGYANALAVTWGSDVYIVGDNGSSDYLLVKYAFSNGANLWSRTYNGGSADEAHDVVTDVMANVYITGESDGGATGWDVATLAWDMSGTALWPAPAIFNGPANGWDKGYAIGLCDYGHVRVAGYSENAAGNRDFLALKYNGTNGTQMFASTYDSPDHLRDIAYDLDIGSDRSVYLTGYTRNANANDDYLTVKFDAVGAFQWEITASGPVPGRGYLDDNAWAIVVDENDYVYVTGQSYGPAGDDDFLTIRYSQGTPGPPPEVMPPPWRGQPRTTMQRWLFSNGNQPHIPEIVNNPYGTPTLDLTGWNWLDSYQGRQGVVHRPSSGALQFQLPNYPDLGPAKWLWIQITYWSFIPAYWEVFWNQGWWGWENPPLVARVDHGNNWFTDVVWLTIDQNPPFETLEIWFADPDGGYVDEVVIDTICLICPWDLNGDGVVDVLDLLFLLAHWGQAAPCVADINGDGTVDVLDLLELLGHWGPCPNPASGETINDPFPILSLPYSTTGDTTTFADDYDEVCPYPGSTSNDVVYSYTPSTTQMVDISLCANSMYDTKLYVYQNGHTPGAPLACSDDACTTPAGQPFVSELVALTLTAGNTYYIVVDGYGGQNGFYTLDVTTSQPTGETINDPFLVPSLPYSTVGDTTTFADDYDEVCPYPGSTSNDSVFAYTPVVDEIVDITLCANSQYDTKLYVYLNGHTPGAPFACNDDACTTPAGQPFVSELLGLNLVAGNTYYIVVDGYGGENGYYTLDIN